MPSFNKMVIFIATALVFWSPPGLLQAGSIKENFKKSDIYLGVSGDILATGGFVCGGQLGVFYDQARRMLAFETCQGELDQAEFFKGTYNSRGFIWRFLGDTKIVHPYLSYFDRQLDGTIALNGDDASTYATGRLKTRNREWTLGAGTLFIFDSGFTFGGDIRFC